MPNFVYTGLDGKTWELATHKGSVLLVNFWATWCGPCKAELPDIVDLANQYKPKGLITVGVSMDEGGKKVVEPFVKKVGIPYPILLPKADDPLTHTIPSIPVTILVDKQGRIAYKFVGARSRAEFEPAIKSLLDEKA